MPGYVMHLAEAELLFPLLEQQRGTLSEEWKNWFRLGSLLPDTKRRTQKASSHFWNPADEGKLALAPDLGLFLQRYGAGIRGPLMEGYYTHLHLDERFVHVFWKEQFSFLDEAGRPEVMRDRIRTVRILRTGREIPEERFFSAEYYYGDYARMNDHFLRTYRLVRPDWRELPDCPVREVRWEDMKTVLEEIRRLMRGEYSFGSEKDLKVFHLEQLEAFIRESAGEMAGILCRIDEISMNG